MDNWKNVFFSNKLVVTQTEKPVKCGGVLGRIPLSYLVGYKGLRPVRRDGEDTANKQL